MTETLKRLSDDILLAQSFFFVGTHRPPEPTEQTEFDRIKDSIPAKHIRLENLDPNGVVHLLNLLLELPTEETLPLAYAIHDKTQGNPFFVIQFIRMMEEKQILSFSRMDLKWEFNLQRVSTEMVSANVADILTQKLQVLSSTQQTIITLASTLGSSEFEQDVIWELYQARATFTQCEGESNDEFTTDVKQFTADIEHLVKEGILFESNAESRYRFAHDRVRQAGLQLLPQDEGEQLRLLLHLGRRLRQLVTQRKEAQSSTLLLCSSVFLYYPFKLQ